MKDNHYKDLYKFFERINNNNKFKKLQKKFCLRK